MNKKSIIKKAVFPVAGVGSRFLPATKAMPKELMPIIDKPLIQYAAEEAVSAGIETLIFITGRNKRAIEDHFDNNRELEIFLRDRGKIYEADMVRSILPPGIECIFVRQAEQLGLGHAVLCSQRAVGDEPFAVLLADDFIVSDNKNPVVELVDAFYRSGRLQLSAIKVDGPDISKYGVLVPGKENRSVKGLVEKPSFEDAPSNLASIGRYILTPDIFGILKDQVPGANGEIQLADAIDKQAKLGNVEATIIDQLHFDCC